MLLQWPLSFSGQSLSSSQPGMTVALFQHHAMPSKAVGPMKCRVSDKDRMPLVFPRRAFSYVLCVVSWHKPLADYRVKQAAQQGPVSKTTQMDLTLSQRPCLPRISLLQPLILLPPDQCVFYSGMWDGCWAIGHVFEMRFGSISPLLCKLGDLTLSESQFSHP